MIELSTGANLQDSKRAKVVTDSNSVRGHKAAKYDAIWDLTLVWIVIAARRTQNTIKALRWRLAAALRAATGWRSEVGNISRKNGVLLKTDEVWVRYYRGKTTKGAWSRWTILKKSKAKEVCTVSLLKEYIQRTNSLPISPIQVPDPDSTATVDDLPLFITVVPDKSTKQYGPIKKTTITQMTKEALAFLQDTRGPLAAVSGPSRYAAHSYRSAVISFLSAAKVELSEVQNRVHSTSAPVVHRHYLVPVMAMCQRTQEEDIDDVLRSGYYWWRDSNLVLDVLTAAGWKEICKGEKDFSSLTPDERSAVLKKLCRG